MWKVDIYLENAGKSVKRKKGWYGYVLAYQGQRFHTLEGFRETEDTKNERDVRMLLVALSRCKPCEAVIHTKSDGTEIKYKELWQQVSDAAVGKEITFRMGTHEFSGWLQREIQHKEENKDV